MKYVDILIGFETEIGLINNTLEKPSTDDSLFWLNQAVGKFIKLRFNGDLVHGTGYEQTEKRRSDLIKLFKSRVYTLSNEKVDQNFPSHIVYKGGQVNYDKYAIVYPEDYLFTLNEDVIISDVNDKHLMDTCIFECTQDSYMYRINNSLTDFHYRYHRARPLRIRNSKGCELLTDKNYKVQRYALGYLRKPNEITLDDPHGEYKDFEDVTMSEIIKMAAQMYLENTESKRYETITKEILTQE